ncbi:MAG TPA: hypothetical protein PKL77_00270 [Candidatus Omnitrophota bacterium]|nr:hypothetical protein [Candidatus Omnitrophota bacterium]
MSKKVVFIFRSLSNAEAKLFSALETVPVFVALSPEAAVSLEKCQLSYIIPHDYFDSREYNAWFDELLLITRKTGEARIDDGTTIQEILSVEGESLWGLLYPHLAYHLFNLFVFKKIVEKIVVLQSPDQAVILSYRQGDREAVIRDVADSLHIPVSLKNASLVLRLRHFSDIVFNYFFTRAHPWIELINRMPNFLSCIGYFQEKKEMCIVNLKRIIRLYKGEYEDPSSPGTILAVAFASYHSFVRKVANMKMDVREKVVIVKADVLTRDFKKKCAALGIHQVPLYEYLSPAMHKRIYETRSMLLGRLKKHYPGIVLAFVKAVDFPAYQAVRRYFLDHFSSFN